MIDLFRRCSSQKISEAKMLRVSKLLTTWGSTLEFLSFIRKSTIDLFGLSLTRWTNALATRRPKRYPLQEGLR